MAISIGSIFLCYCMGEGEGWVGGEGVISGSFDGGEGIGRDG